MILGPELQAVGNIPQARNTFTNPTPLTFWVKKQPPHSPTTLETTLSLSYIKCKPGQAQRTPVVPRKVLGVGRAGCPAGVVRASDLKSNGNTYCLIPVSPTVNPPHTLREKKRTQLPGNSPTSTWAGWKMDWGASAEDWQLRLRSFAGASSDPKALKPHSGLCVKAKASCRSVRQDLGLDLQRGRPLLPVRDYVRIARRLWYKCGDGCQHLLLFYCRTAP